MHRIMDRAAKAGAVERLKQPNGTVKWKFSGKEHLWPVGKSSGRPGDRRTLPKLGAKPTSAGSIIRWLALDIAKANGGYVTEDEIGKAFGKLRVMHARKAA